jgi:DNA-binding MarR family transcriptional regulator
VTFLELVLQLHGEFRRSLEPIQVTPLQAGVMLYLRRHAESRLAEVAAALRVQPPTMGEVVQDLVRKRWVTKRRSLVDRRALRLQLSPRGKSIAGTIEHQVSHIVATLTEHDGCVLDTPLQKGSFQAAHTEP